MTVYRTFWLWLFQLVYVAVADLIPSLHTQDRYEDLIATDALIAAGVSIDCSLARSCA